MLQIKDPNDEGAPADAGAGATEGEDGRGKGGPDAALLAKMAADVEKEKEKEKKKKKKDKIESYGFFDGVIDGVTISVETIEVMLEGKEFYSTINFYNLMFKSCTPQWTEASSSVEIRMPCRIFARHSLPRACLYFLRSSFFSFTFFPFLTLLSYTPRMRMDLEFKRHNRQLI